MRTVHTYACTCRTTQQYTKNTRTHTYASNNMYCISRSWSSTSVVRAVFWKRSFRVLRLHRGTFIHHFCGMSYVDDGRAFLQFMRHPCFVSHFLVFPHAPCFLLFFLLSPPGKRAHFTGRRAARLCTYTLRTPSRC